MGPRTEISLEELEATISQELKAIRISNRIFSYTCKLNLDEKSIERLTFVNCLFSQGVYVSLQRNQQCFIVASEVELGLLVHGDKVQATSTIYPRISIHTSTIDQVNIEAGSFDQITFYDSSLDDLTIKDSKIVGKWLSISSCRIRDMFTVSKSFIQTEIFIDSTTVSGDCSIEDSQVPKLSWINSQFKSDLDVFTCETSLSFDRLDVGGNVLCLDSYLIDIRIEGCVFHKAFAFEFSEDWNPSSDLEKNQKRRWIIGKIGVLSSAFLGGLDVELDWDQGQYLPVSEIEFVCTSMSKGDSFFSKIEIGKLQFKGINREASFHFLDCIVAERLMFREFINQGRLVINSMKWRAFTLLQISRTVLGPAYFTAIDFTGCFLLFSDSDISSITYTSTVWPKNVVPFRPRPRLFSREYWREYFWHCWLRLHWFNMKEDSDEVAYYSGKRQLYRQLKSAADKMLDRVEALEFQSVEMKVYAKVLQLTKGTFNSERVILFLGRTNQHGQNWWRPIWLAMLISIFFFVPIVIGIDTEIATRDMFHSFPRLLSWYGAFPQILNPVHSLDKLTPIPDAIHPLTWWFDYAHRIVMAFFIFQTVSAFRKYVK